MKLILIATDFSAAARNATSYGIKLAKALNAKIILFHAWQKLSAQLTVELGLPSPEHMLMVALDQLKNEISAYDAEVKTDIRIRALEGEAVDAIVATAKEENADIILTGMKRNGHGITRMLGSTVTGLVGKANVPLIVVPENAGYTFPGDIALANESDLSPETDPHVLDALRDIGEKFRSHLYFIRIAKNRFQAVYEVYNRPFKLTRMLHSLEPLHKVINSRDIPEAINAFVQEYHIQILALMPQRHSLLEKMITGSTTRDIIYETDIPLLILPTAVRGSLTKNEIKEISSHNS